MAEDHCSSDRRQAPGTDEDALMSAHECAARRLPFFLNAWWLRDFKQSSGLVWPVAGLATGAFWSTHCDPLCDASHDFPDDI